MVRNQKCRRQTDTNTESRILIYFVGLQAVFSSASILAVLTITVIDLLLLVFNPLSRLGEASAVFSMLS